MPPGGDGFYYFSAYFLIPGGEYGYFDLNINGETLCTAGSDHEDTLYSTQAGCSGAAFVTEGTKIYSEHTSRVYVDTSFFCSISVFKIDHSI